MRIFTLGWEFPPQKTGGLGVACYGLTKELAQQEVEILFLLPRSQETVDTNTKFLFADTAVGNVVVRPIESRITPYAHSGASFAYYDPVTGAYLYSRSLIEEVHRYAQQAAIVAEQESFDLIHAHDWTSYLAGIAAKNATGKPLILHVHATSFDQAASEHVDPDIYAIEHRAFLEADKIITVSNFTKNIIVEKHGAHPDKITVIHNGCEAEAVMEHPPALAELKEQRRKIILYHGRITIQKGVDYFIRAARRVIDIDPSVVFVVSGSGDMSRQIMEQVGQLGLSRHVIFAGALWDEERDRMYQSADLVVMPSVSEPFGLVPLESVRHGTASLISKQSGVSEVLTHVLKVDFWDVDEMANKIIAAIRYPALNHQLVHEGRHELHRLSWHGVAQKVKDVYHTIVKHFQSAQTN